MMIDIAIVAVIAGVSGLVAATIMTVIEQRREHRRELRDRLHNMTRAAHAVQPSAEGSQAKVARIFCVPRRHWSQAAAFRRLPAHSNRRAACMPRACWRVLERCAVVACSLCLARGWTSIFCFFTGGPSEQSFARRRASRSALTPVLGRPCFSQSSLSFATVRPPRSGGAAPCTRPHNDAPARASDALGCNARASACSVADAHGSESASTNAPVLVRVP